MEKLADAGRSCGHVKVLLCLVMSLIQNVPIWMHLRNLVNFDRETVMDTKPNDYFEETDNTASETCVFQSRLNFLKT